MPQVKNEVTLKLVAETDDSDIVEYITDQFYDDNSGI